MPYDQLAQNNVIEQTKTALEKNGFKVTIVENGAAAKQKAMDLVPTGSEVFTLTSITLEQTGIAKEINESGNYISVRNELGKLDRNTQAREMRKLGAAPDYAMGSVHAITQDGKVLIASGTGSQLPADSYGAGQVVWVVGAQKIVKDYEDGIKRIFDYVLPLESARGRKAYGLPETWNSYPAKILMLNREGNPERINIILVKEVLGF